LNNTKVLPARLFGVKRGSARTVEFLLLNRLSAANWEVILKPGKKLRSRAILLICALPLRRDTIQKRRRRGGGFFSLCGRVFETILDELRGRMPLPALHTANKLEDKTRYQTVYAKIDGSAAAPTAGLHFTPNCWIKIRQKGVIIVNVLLHVGLGTFRP